MKTSTRSLIAGVGLSAGLLAAAQPAFAWGDREQGILAGVAATAGDGLQRARDYLFNASKLP